MSMTREEFSSLLKELRWAKLFGTLFAVFAFFCLTDWKLFKSQGLGFVLRTVFREFLGWLLYGILIIPLMGIALWLLNKIDVRNIGFKIGSLLRGHTRVGKVI